VEILSPSEYRRIRLDKVDDYCKVGVQECWIVSPQAETIEVLRLNPEGYETVDVYSTSQTAQSIAFPELSVPVAARFED
jgi:Uma2 family endonuclease